MPNIEHLTDDELTKARESATYLLRREIREHLPAPLVPGLVALAAFLGTEASSRQTRSQEGS